MTVGNQERRKHSEHVAVLRMAGAVCLTATALLTACSDGKVSQPTAPSPAPVVAATAERRNVPLEVKAIGAIEPYSTVSVKTQVTGELTGIFFKEGQDVHKDDLLFTLDKRQTEAAIRRSEGTLARDQAQLDNARAQAKRYEALWKEGVISKEQYDQVQTSAQAFEAAVRADRGALEDAKVQLTYCTIYSPINGRLGAILVHQGNMIKANDTPALVTINQVQPIYASFTVPEMYLAQIRKQMARGKLRVTALPQNDSGAPAVGALSFVDNMVDQTTGTIRLKAEFANADRRLWPGAFVNTVTRLGDKPNAVVVPSQAVLNGQAGQYVYVIKQDMKVDARTVTIGETANGLTIIEKGIEPGERVVIDGQLRLVPDAQVEITAMTATAGSQ